MAQMTYEQFLASVKPEMLDANGAFKGPDAGVNYAAEGLTPQQFYDQTLANVQTQEASYQDNARSNPLENRGKADPMSLFNSAVNPAWKPGSIGSGFGGNFQGHDSIWQGVGEFFMLAFGGEAMMGTGGAEAGAAATAGGGATGAAADFGAGTYAAGADAAAGASTAAGVGSSAAYSAAMDSQAASLGYGNAQAAIDAGAMPAANGMTATAGSIGAAAAGSATPGATNASTVASSPNGQAAVDAAKSGTSLTDLATRYGPTLAKAALGVLSGNGGALINAAGTVAGTAAQASASRAATQQQIDGINQAAGILAPAYIDASTGQATAQTTGAQQLATGYTNAADTLAAADLAAGNLKASGYTAAGALGTQGLQGASKEVQDTLDSQVALQKPYQQAGMGALNTLSAGLAPGGQFNRAFSEEDMKNVMPAYTFAEKQAQAAMNAKMAAGGQNLSSNAIQGAGTLAAGLASQYETIAFNQWMAQNNLSLGALQNMVATGQISTGQLSNALANAGVSQAGIQTAIGQVQGNAAIGAAGAQAAGIQGAGQAKSTGIMGAANATAQGTVGAANAIAAGKLGAAGANASAAQQSGAVAAGGTVSQGNIIGAGATAAGNQLASMGNFSSIFGNNQSSKTPADSPGGGIFGGQNNSGPVNTNNGGTEGFTPASFSPPSTPVAPVETPDPSDLVPNIDFSSILGV